MLKTRSLIFSAIVGVAAVASGTAFAADRTLTVVNKTKSTMYAFYGSSVGAGTWEEDILGDETVAPGESIEIDMDDGTGACRFDVKAEFKDGTDIVQGDLDVCKVGELTLTE